jgi:hypothetical protein
MYNVYDILPRYTIYALLLKCKFEQVVCEIRSEVATMFIHVGYVQLYTCLVVLIEALRMG